MPLAFWVCAGLTAVSAAVSLGFSVAGLKAADGPGSHTASRYALARSAALLAVAATAVFAGDVGFELAAAGAMVLVQALDAFVGAANADRLKTAGPALTAAANLAALIWLLATEHLG
ncbi:MAG: hypothetical protein LBL01_03370 [Bifidobacteriaceae bacterium]|jgi:hypothetical protein|nr:hypothetical protein [Bifidobacteriaceae bacterium]